MSDFLNGHNRDKVQSTAERILSICGEAMCFERILQEVFKGYGLSMNFEQYGLGGKHIPVTETALRRKRKGLTSPFSCSEKPG